ncbi:MAG TPA: LysM peptidoglycan-binding domain-containing protein [Bacteroidetes bacterium]|nr:LysM peptidoglycan-binding domain-containing protein [Bacteroidota bacterium]
MRNIATLILIVFTAFGYSANAFAQKKITSEEYIKRYQGLAISQMKKYGVPASIILAQGLLESGSGNSTLAVKANNHFGIKCHKTWTGPRIYHDDDARGECFRKYRSPEKSYQDHSEFLRGARRYAFLFDLNPTDYKGWANGLKKAGYATDPQYPQKLIRIIEEYKLYTLDTGVDISIESPTKGMGEEIDPENFSIDIFNQRKLYMKNRIKYIIVEKGDTYEELTRELELMPWQLAKYNEIERGAKLDEGQELFIQPKRRKAEVNHPLHIAEEGETMYEIAQMYGVRLKWLYRRNRMQEGEEPVAGEKIFLRGRKPKNE